MVKPKLNVFYKVFILIFILLNLCILLVISFQKYQLKINTEIQFTENLVEQNQNLQKYFRNYRDEGIFSDIKKLVKSANAASMITKEKFAILSLKDSVLTSVFSNSKKINQIEYKQLKKLTSNILLHEQLNSQINSNDKDKFFSTLLSEEKEYKLFFIYYATFTQPKWFNYSFDDTITFEVLLVVLSILLALFTKNIFSKFQDQINSTIYHVLNGNYDRRLKLLNTPEFDKVNANINLLLDKIEGYKEYHREYEKHREEITLLLNIVNRASDGDFTVKAELSEGLLGYLSDSFNIMLVELGNLFLDVKTAAEQITSFTNHIMKNAEQISESSEQQTKKIESVFKLTQDMSEQLDNSFKKAQGAQNAISLTSKIAKTGSKDIFNTLEQIHQLKVTVKNTIRNVRGLGENTKEIQGVLDESNDFTARTNLLALNATIEASRGNEGTKGLAFIADEIRQLAEKSKSAAKDIQKLLESIKSGTMLTINSIESSADEIEKGTKFIDEAGKSFNEIVNMVTKTSELIQGMVTNLEEQAINSNEIFEVIAFLADVAKNEAKRAAESKQLTFQMNSLSQNLMKAVSKFKLKETNFGVIK